MTKKIIIIGGGLAGLSAAYFLNTEGMSFTLYEQNDRFGGFCKTEESNGFYYDYTGHLLHFKDQEIKSLVLDDLLKGNWFLHARKSFIYLQDRYLKYPFQQNLYNLPFWIKMECFFGYLLTLRLPLPKSLKIFTTKKIKSSEGINLYDWAIKYFGRGISKYFMIPYNEKIWRLAANEMSVSWMKGYVPRPSLLEVFNGTFFDSKGGLGYNAKFYYPKKGGIQALVDGFVKKLPEKRLFKNKKITEIYLHNKMVNGDKFDKLITTMPLRTLILDVILDVDDDIKEKAKKLKANFVLNVNIGLKKKVIGKHWIYFPDDKFIFHRIGFINNFAEGMTPHPENGSIYTEISAKKELDNLEWQVIEDLIKVGIIKDFTDVIDIKTLKLPDAYASYDQQHDQIVADILAYLKKFEIYSIGRYGKWEYAAMEDAMRQGRDIAKDILNA